MKIDIVMAIIVMPEKTTYTVEEIKEFCKKHKCELYTLDGLIINNTTVTFKAGCECFDLEETIKAKNLKVEDYTLISDYKGIFKYKNNKTGSMLEVDIWHDPDVKTKIKQVTCLFIGECVEHQTVETNEQFFEDETIKKSQIVVDNKTLLQHWEKYFSNMTDTYYGKHIKHLFKDKIVDKFIEGKHVVMYI